MTWKHSVEQASTCRSGVMTLTSSCKDRHREIGNTTVRLSRHHWRSNMTPPLRGYFFLMNCKLVCESRWTSSVHKFIAGIEVKRMIRMKTVCFPWTKSTGIASPIVIITFSRQLMSETMNGSVTKVPMVVLTAWCRCHHTLSTCGCLLNWVFSRQMISNTTSVFCKSCRTWKRMVNITHLDLVIGAFCHVDTLFQNV